MAKDTYYFTHDSNARNDIKMLKLRRDLGMEGYGVYFAIIEVLRDQSEYKLNIDNIEDIAFELRVDTDKVNRIVRNYGLFIVDGGMFYSPSLLNRMAQYNELKAKRIEAGKKGRQMQLDGQRPGIPQAQPEQTLADARALNEMKVNESKLNEIKEKEITEGNEADANTNASTSFFENPPKSETPPINPPTPPLPAKPKPKPKPNKILFVESEFFEFEKFELQFLGTDYQHYNLRVYYEKIKNWSASEGAKKVDWIATARNFMLGDYEKGKAVLKPQNTLYGQQQQANTNRNTGGKPNLDNIRNELEKWD